MSQKPEYFGKYILLEKLATGGMAEVWLARAPGAGGIGKFVAIKKILPQFSDNPEFLQMFKDEATIAMNLSHGNIVSIYELGQEKNQLFLVMDFVEGRNLRQILNKMKNANNHKFAIDQIVYIMKEVAGGLDHAHRSLNSATGKPLNIIHRDMSPQNIMISFEGEVKIVDFGIAKAESQIENTRTGTLKGKFGYMSPEQAEGQQTDLRTDIFSVGIVLWELLANDRLFIANNEINTLRKIRECNIPSLSKLNPNVAPELERIVMKALTRDRNLRYQTAAAMHRDLNRFLNRQYPDFSPHDFSVFIKTLYTDEILELRSRQVDYAKIPFRATTVRSDEDKTMVTSFPQLATPKKGKKAGAIASTQTIRTTKTAVQDPTLTETETFTGSTPSDETVTKAPLADTPSEKKEIEMPLGQNGVPLLNANLLANLESPIAIQGKNPIAIPSDSPPIVKENAGVFDDGLALQTVSRVSKKRRSSSKKRSSNASLNIMIFLAGMIVTYVVVSSFFPGSAQKLQGTLKDLFSVTPQPVPMAPMPKINSFPTPSVPLAPTPQPAPLPPPSVGLTVASVPSGAEIYVNNNDTGKTTPSVVNVPSDGSFSIGLRLDRYLDYTKKNLTIDRTGLTFTATLQQALMGYVDIDVRPPVNAKIYVNGRLLHDVLPISDYAIQAETPVRIRAENPLTGSEAERTIVVRKDSRTSIILNLEDRRIPASHRHRR